ncbi:MAG: hypothetical protein PHQ12_13020, partial [Chthoniobacteraceae bacterium]|nr:hypothetical protein [Chthoniobacteraceae bacterium]
MAVDGTWIYTAGTNWSDTTRWLNGTLADGQGATADFTAATLTKASTITIDTTPRTVGILNIGDAGGAFGYTIAASNGATLTFDNGSSHAQINQVALSGGNTISAPVILNSDLDVTNLSGNTLTISGAVSGAHAITYSSAGTFALNGVVSGVTAITNSGGGALTLGGANTGFSG